MKGTLLSKEFMHDELNYDCRDENINIAFKDMYYKMCNYVSANNVYKPTTADIENWLNTGKFNNHTRIRSGISSECERKYLFKRAMGLQLIYDLANGRNTLITGTDKSSDITREAKDSLDMLGLIQLYGW